MMVLFVIFAFHLVSAELFVEEAQNDISSVVKGLLKKVREHDKIFSEQNQIISNLRIEVAHHKIKSNLLFYIEDFYYNNKGVYQAHSSIG